MDVNEITNQINQLVRLHVGRPLVHSKQHFIERTVTMLNIFTIRKTMNKTQTGFTLIELIITLAVVAIAVAIGVPSLQRITESNRGASQNNLIRGSLADARNIAINRGMNVVLCGSDNSTTGTPSCDTADWEKGWIIFADVNKDNKFVAADNDTLLGASGGLAGGLTLRAIDQDDTSLNKVIFLPSGALGPDGGAKNISFKVCTPDADTKKARAINIIVSGLMNNAMDTDATPDSIVNDVTTNNVACP